MPKNRASPRPATRPPRTGPDHNPEADSERQTLGEMVGRLGPSMLRVAAAPADTLDRRLTGVTVFDPLVAPEDSPGQLLLGVGVDPDAAASDLVIEDAAAHGFCGVVVHADGPPAPAMLDAAQRHGIAMLTTSSNVSWAHLTGLLRVGMMRSAQELAGVPLGDLFAFANSLADRINGAVTIEDPQSHVLAYSSVKEEVDEPRKETILGRQVPQKYTRLLQERGVFRKLLTCDDVVEMDAVPEVALRRRVAVSIRAAEELLGSIWVAEAGGPLVDDYERALQDAAQTATLHIMRQRLALQAETGLRATMTRNILDGTSADVAAVRLALVPEASYAVVALEAPHRGVNRNRLREVVELYASISGRNVEVADMGPRVYALLPTARPEYARRFAIEACRRSTSALQQQAYAAIGPVVGSVNGAVISRQEADRVMRVLLRPGSERTVAALDEVRAHAGLLEILDLLRDRPHLCEGPVTRLEAQPEEKRVVLVATLRSYLDHHGDVRSAAAAMNVHGNTFRYRLHRAAQLAQVDLGDSAERLMLALQLRLGG